MPHKKDHFDKYTFQRILNNLTEDDLKNKFRPRGIDAFKKSLIEGDDQNFIERSFSKTGDERKYPYLSSRYLINPRVENINKDYAPRPNRSSIKEDIDRKQQARARRGVSGNPEYLKSLEESAKKVSEIQDNLQNAMMLSSQGNTSADTEQAMSNAIYDAQQQFQNVGLLGQRPPIDPNTGEYITNDPRYVSAKMIDNYNQARKRAVDAQDASEYYRDFFESKAEEAERMKIDPYNTTNKIGQFKIKNPFDPKYGS